MMTKIRLTNFILIVLAIFAAAPAFVAQSTIAIMSSGFLDQQNGLTADEAVRAALANNGDLEAMRKEAESAEKLIAQAGQRARISVEAGGMQETIGKAHSYSIQGSMPLELGGRRRTRIVTAEKMAEIKNRAVIQKEAELAAMVRSKFGQSLNLVLKLELTEELLDSLSRSYSLIQERVKEGKTAPLEENMMLVELNRVHAMREKAKSAAQVSLLELEALIGRDDQRPLRLKGSLDGQLTNFAGRNELTARAIRERPDLLLLRSMEDLADAKIEEAGSEGKLDAAATLGYQRLRMTEVMQFNQVVFGIRFLLPFKNRSRDAIAAAVIDKEAMEQRREFGELVVRQDVAKTLVRYESAVRTREITRTGVVEEARRNLNVVRQMYELGSVSLLEFLAEQRRVIDLRNELIDAELEVYLARIEVLRATNAPELVTK